VLEIGCGTGQATVSLAARRYAVTAVELGASLAEVASANLVAYRSVEVLNEDFEWWQGPEAAFDLVVCATAWHWIDPATRLERVAAALRPGGVVAVIDTVHVAGTSDAFFAAAQRCYERWDPDTPPGLLLPGLDTLPPAGSHELDRAEQFEDVELQRFGARHAYTAWPYLELLSTFSGHRALPADRLEGLFGCLRRLIDAEPKSMITKSSVFELRTAVRR